MSRHAFPAVYNTSVKHRRFPTALLSFIRFQWRSISLARELNYNAKHAILCRMQNKIYKNRMISLECVSNNILFLYLNLNRNFKEHQLQKLQNLNEFSRI